MEFIKAIAILFVIFGIPKIGSVIFDYYRIKDDIRVNGGRLIKAQWKLMDGDGNWSNDARIFFVTYIDTFGNKISKYCRIGKGYNDIHWK